MWALTSSAATRAAADRRLSTRTDSTPRAWHAASTLSAVSSEVRVTSVSTKQRSAGLRTPPTAIPRELRPGAQIRDRVVEPVGDQHTGDPTRDRIGERRLARRATEELEMGAIPITSGSSVSSSVPLAGRKPSALKRGSESECLPTLCLYGGL